MNGKGQKTKNNAESPWSLMLSLGVEKGPIYVSAKRTQIIWRGKQVLSSCGAMRSDMEIRLKNLGSFSKTNPIWRVFLRLFEVIPRGLADFLGVVLGWCFGLMLLKLTGGTAAFPSPEPFATARPAASRRVSLCSRWQFAGKAPAATDIAQTAPVRRRTFTCRREGGGVGWASI